MQVNFYTRKILENQKLLFLESKKVQFKGGITIYTLNKKRKIAPPFLIILFICSLIGLFLVVLFFTLKKFFLRKPELSVIIPIYNTEEYLTKCLDSVANQTFKDIEIICVDDGSTDNSLSILNEYKQKDTRIKIINKENGGVSSARNSGIEKSRGTYLTFLDSDDWIDLDLYEKCLEKMKLENADILNFGLMFEPSHTYGKTVESKTFTDPFYVLENDFMNCSVYTRIFKSSLIKDNHITFMDDVKYGEDSLFLTMAFPHAKVITNQPGVYYHYFMRDSSIEHTLGVESRLISAIRRCHYMTKYYLENEYKNAYDWLLCLCLDITYYRIAELKDAQKQAEYAKQVLDILNENLIGKIEKIPNDLQEIIDKMGNYANFV